MGSREFRAWLTGHLLSDLILLERVVSEAEGEENGNDHYP